jgi:hypothetical protein
MIRAVLLGLLMPPSDVPKRDREIFLKIMKMDEDGLWKRMCDWRHLEMPSVLTHREVLPKRGIAFGVGIGALPIATINESVDGKT